MAIVQVCVVSNSMVRGAVWRGVAVGRIMPGDQARPVWDVRRFLAGLPEEARRELGSRLNLQAVRAKMKIEK